MCMINTYYLYVVSKEAELIEIERRMVVARSWGVGEMSDDDQRVQIASYKMNEFWRCNVQHGDCSRQHYIEHLKFAGSRS